jgi:hypothetical protein
MDILVCIHPHVINLIKIIMGSDARLGLASNTFLVSYVHEFWLND